MRLLAAALLAASLAAPARAAFNSGYAGTSGGEFLKLGGDARGASMGQAMAAASEDAMALFYDPAGLSQLQQREGTASQGFLYQNVTLSYVGYAHPVSPIVKPARRFMRPSGLGTLALGVLYLNSGNISEIDNTGTPTGGQFTPRDVAAIAGWGATLTDYFDFGLSFKYVESRIEASARTGAADFGARLRLDLAGLPYTAALVARNLGGQMRFHAQTDPLPVEVRLGQTLRVLPQWLMSVDLAFPRDGAPYPAFGTEYSFRVDDDISVAVRGGYDGRVSAAALDGIADMCFGLGATRKGWGIDYGWVPFGVLGHTHRFSLTYRF
ncbi:MAG: PorV/PorQ family protein [Elusimicrobia bacterium]|nr:PorV/PorQ family protein [Elusimicrobiota bacterium]